MSAQYKSIQIKYLYLVVSIHPEARGIVAEPLIYSARSGEYISDGADSPTQAKPPKAAKRSGSPKSSFIKLLVFLSCN